MRPIPLSVPTIGRSAWKYVKECLDTQWVSSVGRYVTIFEEAVARYAGSRRAVAGVNGTACLHLAGQLCGLGPGDAALVPALTFIATANAVSYTGATCVFLDCEPGRFNLDLDKLEEFLALRCRKTRGGLVHTATGLKVRVLVAVHVLGYPLDMDRLMRISREHGLAVIEDAAESIGSYWNGRHTGIFGRLGVLSFNGNKIITTGGGGMILAQSEALADRAKHLTQQAKAAEHEYVHDAIGYNYRMTNISAALGVSQMESLPTLLDKRRRVSSWYGQELKGLPVAPHESKARWNRWLLSVQASSTGAAAKLLARMQASGIQARPLWMPVPMQAPYRRHPSEPIPNARRAYATVVNIPSSASLSREEVARIGRTLSAADLFRALI